MSHTFTVNDNEIGEYFKQYCPKMRPFTEWCNEYKLLEGETVYASDAKTVGGRSPLFHAISYAFNNHCPLVITPDAVWLTILNGLVHHIDTDPEGLRHHFVDHEGQKELVVKVWSPSLPNVPKEVWEEGVQKFRALLQENIGKKADLITCDFSTTTETDRISSEIALMGAMKHYFSYKMMLLCGLNKITIAGEATDWVKIHDRVQVLSEFGLSWWTDQLLPIIREFDRACRHNPDIDFWKQVYLKQRKGSGGQFDVSGWINVFYPYISRTTGGYRHNQPPQGEMVRNPCMEWGADKKPTDPDDFPSGLVAAPVVLDDHGTQYNFKFYGGLVGVSIAEDYTTKPESGWAIQNLGRKE